MIVAFIIEACLLLYFCNCVSETSIKDHAKLPAILWFLLYILFKCLWEMHYYLNLVGMVLLTATYLGVLRNRDWKINVWLGILFAILIQTGRSVVYIPLVSIGYPWMEHQLEFRILAAVIKILMVLTVSGCFRRIALRRISALDYLIAMIPLSNLIYLNRYLTFLDADGNVIQACMVSFYFMEFSVFMSIMAMVWKVSYASQREEDEKLEAVILEQHKAAEQKKDADEAVRRMYHDLKNQLLGLSALAGSSEAQKMTSDMLEQIRAYEMVPYTENSVVNSILNEKAQKAASEGISLQLFVDVEKADFIRNADMCVIFGNILDNALEAAEEIQDKSKKIVSLKAMEQFGFFVIKASNYYSHTLKAGNHLFETTKSDRESHGIGLSSVEYSVKKYNGTLKLEPCEDQFVVTIVIPSPSDS